MTGHPAARAEAVSPPAVEKAEGEVAGAEDDDGAERDLALADVGPRQGCPLGLRRVDPGLEVVTRAHHDREQAQAASRAAELAGEAGHGQAALGGGPLDDAFAIRLEVPGDGLEEGSALFG